MDFSTHVRPGPHFTVTPPAGLPGIGPAPASSAPAEQHQEVPAEQPAPPSSASSAPAEQPAPAEQHQEVPAEQPAPAKRRGFAAMSPERQREIAAAGGRAAHKKGTAHTFTPEEAQDAGRKGGAVIAARGPEYMQKLGKRRHATGGK